MTRTKKWIWGLLFGTITAIVACQINNVECYKDCTDGWMDSGNFRDSCADDSNKTCLVSKRIAAPKDTDLAKPVIIAVHGFTASTYEWWEFKKFAEPDSGKPKALVSLVLLGGHGRDIDTFQSSTWKDWGRPILKEYDSLVAKGYKNISFAASSTGAALMMQYIADGAFRSRKSPNWFFLIDPIVIPTSKLLSLANLVGPILGNSPHEGTALENKHWYVNRPEEDLRQLYELINRVKNHLEDGFELPEGTQAKVFKSKTDNSADPISALYIYKGMRKAGGGHIQVELVDSKLHVFTRLDGRALQPDAAKVLQQRVFGEMTDKVKTFP